MQRTMKAMILAAGFGTRLRPLTEEVPKPLVPVLGRPLIEHTIEMLAAAGIYEIVINLHHLPEMLPQALGKGSHLGVSIEYVVEEEGILGTGGGIHGARHLLDNGETFVVINGDILLQPDLVAALEHHRRLGAPATLVLRHDPRASAYGALGVDAEGRIRTLLGRPEVTDIALEQVMFSGVHLLEPAIFDRLPEEGCIVRQVYRPMLDTGELIGGFIDAGPWVELGTVRDYLDVNLALLRGDLQLEGVDVPADKGILVEEGAELDDDIYLIPPVFVGAGAKVRADVARSVVWPGAVVDQSIEDAVVTPRGVARG